MSVKIELQKQIQEFQKSEKEIGKAVQSRTQLESQLKENEQVQKEFDQMSEDSVIFKLIGPCLVKQDQSEAKSNVAKRIEFIQGEIKRSEILITDLQGKQEKLKLKVFGVIIVDC
jgi:prefoldin beta subunit